MLSGLDPPTLPIFSDQSQLPPLEVKSLAVQAVVATTDSDSIESLAQVESSQPETQVSSVINPQVQREMNSPDVFASCVHEPEVLTSIAPILILEESKYYVGHGIEADEAAPAIVNDIDLKSDQATGRRKQSSEYKTQDGANVVVATHMLAEVAISLVAVTLSEHRAMLFPDDTLTTDPRFLKLIFMLHRRRIVIT
jgi:hypothetical protein